MEYNLSMSHPKYAQDYQRAADNHNTLSYWCKIRCVKDKRIRASARNWAKAHGYRCVTSHTGEVLSVSFKRKGKV